MDQFLDPETDTKHQFLDPENVIMVQFLDQETDIKHQFLHTETDKKYQFLTDRPETDVMNQFLHPETDFMGEGNYIRLDKMQTKLLTPLHTIYGLIASSQGVFFLSFFVTCASAYSSCTRMHARIFTRKKL